MEPFGVPVGLLPSDEAINGYYPVTAAPAAVMDTDSMSPQTFAAPVVGDVNATLLWWLILLGFLIGLHMLTLRFQE